MRELEVAAAEAVSELAPHSHGAPPPGAVCANCGAVLEGPFCHACGQSADIRHRSVGHLIIEGFEGLFHYDGRLRRTIPDLFFHPGRLARDHMEGRIARHVPPLRTFLVALLLLIAAAEQGAHGQTQREAARNAAHEALLKTPQGRAGEVARLRAEAARDRDADLKEDAGDRADDLKDPEESRPRIEARHARQTAATQARYAKAMAQADRVAQGLPAEAPDEVGPTRTRKNAWFDDGLHKAIANPEYYWSILFTWAHRAAILLLPIVGLSLALVYARRRRYFIYDHLIVAMNFLSFVFLANAVGLILPPPYLFYWLGAVAIWTPINLFQTLRGAYGSTIAGAMLKAAVVWSISLFAFLCLLMGLLVFSLSQL